MENRATNNTQMAFSEEQAMLLESAQNFCRDQSSIAIVRSLLDKPQSWSDEVWTQMVELGWTGVALPEQYGGSGLGVGALVPLLECMGRALMGAPLMSSALLGQAILRAGNSEQKERWLPALAEGHIGSLALLDNDDWGDTRIQCKATQEGDLVTLSGTKPFVDNGLQSQIIGALVTVNDQAALAIISGDALAQASRNAHVSLDETKRSARLNLDCVTVSRSDLIQGPALENALHDVRLLGALFAAAEAAGSMGACLDLIVDYLKTRKQFGRLIGSHQALKHPTVEILNDLNSLRSLVYHAATICGSDPLDADAEIACRMAKASATTGLVHAADRAVQFHGGMGFTYECDAQLYARRAQWVQSQFGDSAHHNKRLAVLLFD